MEYDFVPSELSVEQGTLLHFQWTGSDANPNGNAGGAGAGNIPIAIPKGFMVGLGQALMR